MRINDQIRKQIIKDYATGKYTHASLAAKYGVSRTSVARITNPDYREKEREAQSIAQRSYVLPKPTYSLNIRFYDKDKELIDKLKSEDNVHQYIKDLIAADIKKGNL